MLVNFHFYPSACFIWKQFKFFVLIPGLPNSPQGTDISISKPVREKKKKKTCKDFIENRPIMIPETNLKLIPFNSTLAVEERCSRSQIISEPGGITGIIYAHHVLRWIFLFNTPCLLQITWSSPGWSSNPFLVSPDIWIPLIISSVFDSKYSRALIAYA